MEISIDEPLNVDWDGNELLLSDILGTEEDTVYKNMETEMDHSLLTAAVSHLTERNVPLLNCGTGSTRLTV